MQKEDWIIAMKRKKAQYYDNAEKAYAQNDTEGFNDWHAGINAINELLDDQKAIEMVKQPTPAELDTEEMMEYAEDWVYNELNGAYPTFTNSLELYHKAQRKTVPMKMAVATHLFEWLVQDNEQILERIDKGVKKWNEKLAAESYKKMMEEEEL